MEVSNKDISYELYSYEACGEVMEFLAKNKDFDKLKELIKLQGHTAGTMSLFGQVMLYFSSYGLEFVDNIVGDRLGLLANLKDEYNKEYFKKLIDFVNKEYKEKTIYPPKNEIFNALRHTPYKDVKVVILGQDPYHGEHQAEGL